MQPQKTPEIPVLPLQMMLAMGTWLSSPSASACARSAWQPWKLDSVKLNQAVQEEAKNRANSFLSGLLRYLETPYSRTVPEPPVVWKRGSARLLNYSSGKSGSAVALFIPSLINRYYVLDLDEKNSLLRYLAEQGVATFVLDWGTPGEYEKDFGCADYIEKLLLPAIEFLHRTTGKKITLAGYCMGGVFSLAAITLKPDYINKFALLATPWNFHCHSFSPFILGDDWEGMIAAQIGKDKHVPAEFIQSLFYWTAPWVFEQKYRRFAQMPAAAAAEFIGVERWVNDGVPMTVGVARECLIDWAQKNVLANGKWQVSGKKIDPRKIKIPAFVVIPENDHVVPRDCALPLANSLWQRKVITPHAGHVSMIVGADAKKQLWEPLRKWLID